MIVEGKTWKETDKIHATKTGAYSASTSLACGKFADTALGKKEVFKGLRVDELSEANEKALKQAKHIKVEKDLSKKLVERNGNSEIGERASKILVRKSKEYKEALKDFAHCNFLKKEMDTYQGWFKGTVEAGIVCVIAEGGIKK